MRKSAECPSSAERETIYYCQLLSAQRRGEDEEICSFCADFLERLEASSGLRQAFEFAAEAHGGQFRKGTDIPYLIHLVRTWYYDSQMTEDEEEMIVALLHDVLEDTSVTEEELRERFGARVAGLVAGESECKREELPAGETWKIRKEETIERLRELARGGGDEAAIRVTFADKLANLYSMAFEFRRVGDRLWRKFNQKDKAMHGWYYGEMGKIFDDCITGRGAELVADYRRYYEEVFGEDEVQVGR